VDSQAVLDSLDQDMREWRVEGMNGSPEERAQFLKSCFLGARFNMRVALLATPILRPGKTQREVFDEIVPKVIENVAEQGRNSGYTDEQVKLYVDAHERAYRAFAAEFGFVEMTHDEIESLKEF
jgi:hypothetical protein